MQLSEQQFCADWVARMGELTPLTTATVLQYLNLRAQADARPDWWWNGIRKPDWHDGTAPSFNLVEDTWHDIPLYSGANPCNLPQAVAPDMLNLLREARATLEMWKDVAPAGSLCADIDRALTRASAATVAEPSVSPVPEGWSLIRTEVLEKLAGKGVLEGTAPNAQQAEPGADERAACEAAWNRRYTCVSFDGFGADYLRGWLDRAAQSGQRAGVADEVIERLALKHIAPHAKKFFPEDDYKASEQFRRVKAYTLELLSEAK